MPGPNYDTLLTGELSRITSEYLVYERALVDLYGFIVSGIPLSGQ